MRFSGRPGSRAAHAAGATLFAGLLTYVILAIVSRTVTAAEFDQFSVFWSIALIVGFGVFLPVEQETARLGRNSSISGSLMPVMMRSTAALAAIVGLLLVALVPIMEGALGLPPILAWSGVAVVVASAVQFAGRARLLAEGRATAFTNTLIADSALRAVLFTLVALWIAAGGPTSPDVWFAAALIGAVVAAHAWAVPWRWSPVNPAVAGEFVRALGFLIGIGICAQVLVNSGPIIIQAMSTTPGLAGAFQASSSLARIPLAMITPIQAMLVGPLAARAVNGDVAGVTVAMRRVAVAGIILATVGALGAWLVGPWFVALVFGQGRALPAADLALLVAGVIIHVVLIVFTQAVIATGRHRAAMLAWLCALGTAIAVFLVAVATGGPVLAVELGFGVGSLAGGIIALFALLRGTRSESSE